MTREEKKLQIRRDIFLAVGKYKDHLVGRCFLYIFDNRYIEVTFKADNFKHLTGVDSNLHGKDFYNKAKNHTLTTSQFYFSEKHPYNAAKKKIRYLHRLDELTNTDIFLLEKMGTNTITYKFGFTNLEFSLGLTENIKSHSGEKIDDFYLPQTFRIKDKSFDRSKDIHSIDLIFEKDDKLDKYKKITFGDKDLVYKLPEKIQDLLDLEELK